MSDKEETFEDILRSRLSENQFSFDEENWEKAEDMIMSYRKKEKIKRAALLFFAGLLVGIVIMFPFIYRTENTTHQPIAQNNESPANTTITGEQQNLSNTTGSFNSLKHTEHKNQIKNNNNNYSASAEGLTQTTIHSNKPHFALISKPVINGGINKADHKQQAPAGDATNGINDLATDKNTNDLTITKNLTTSKEAINIGTNEKTDVVVVKDSVITTAKTDTVAAVTTVDSVLKDSTALVKKDSAAKSFSDKEKPGSAFVNPWQLSVFVGGNYLLGRTLNPIQGFEFIKPIDSTWSFGTGLSYTYLNIKTSNAVKTIVTSATYDFGYTANVVQIKTNDLHYIIMPVFAQYHINEKNSVIVGANNYMLLTVSNNYSTYKESNGDKQNVNSSKTFGYFSGFNRYDIGVLLGYKRRLFNNLSLNLYVNYGLLNINKAGYYTDNTFQRNVSGQMMLVYRLH